MGSRPRRRNPTWKQHPWTIHTDWTPDGWTFKTHSLTGSEEDASLTPLPTEEAAMRVALANLPSLTHPPVPIATLYEPLGDRGAILYDRFDGTGRMLTFDCYDRDGEEMCAVYDVEVDADLDSWINWQAVADATGIDVEDLLEMASSSNVVDRAWALFEAGGYHGFHELTAGEEGDMSAEDRDARYTDDVNAAEKYEQQQRNRNPWPIRREFSRARKAMERLGDRLRHNPSMCEAAAILQECEREYEELRAEFEALKA